MMRMRSVLAHFFLKMAFLTAMVATVPVQSAPRFSFMRSAALRAGQIRPNKAPALPILSAYTMVTSLKIPHKPLTALDCEGHDLPKKINFPFYSSGPLATLFSHKSSGRGSGSKGAFPSWAVFGVTGLAAVGVASADDRKDKTKMDPNSLVMSKAHRLAECMEALREEALLGVRDSAEILAEFEKITASVKECLSEKSSLMSSRFDTCELFSTILNAYSTNFLDEPFLNELADNHRKDALTLAGIALLPHFFSFIANPSHMNAHMWRSIGEQGANQTKGLQLSQSFFDCWRNVIHANRNTRGVTLWITNNIERFMRADNNACMKLLAITEVNDWTLDEIEHIALTRKELLPQSCAVLAGLMRGAPYSFKLDALMQKLLIDIAFQMDQARTLSADVSQGRITDGEFCRNYLDTHYRDIDMLALLSCVDEKALTYVKRQQLRQLTNTTEGWFRHDALGATQTLIYTSTGPENDLAAQLRLTRREWLKRTL